MQRATQKDEAAAGNEVSNAKATVVQGAAQQFSTVSSNVVSNHYNRAELDEIIEKIPLDNESTVEHGIDFDKEELAKTIEISLQEVEKEVVVPLEVDEGVAFGIETLGTQSCIKVTLSCLSEYSKFAENINSWIKQNNITRLNVFSNFVKS